LAASTSSADAGASNFVIGVDVGGTFTDVVCSSTTAVWRAKAPTDPQEFQRGVVEACELVAQQAGLGLEALLNRVERFGLGTTAVTNVLATRRGPRVGFLTTRGFEEHLHLARGGHISVNGWLEAPWIPVDEEDVVGLDERIDRDGNIVRALDPREVEAAVQDLVTRGVKALAVSLLWSFKNPSHEQLIARVVAETAPDVPVFCGSALHPHMREYERSTMAALSAFTSSALDGVEMLEQTLKGLGLRQPLLLLHSGGGAMSLSEARAMPLQLAASGPAAGAVAAGEVAAAAGVSKAICCDIGGTSVDVAVIRDGEAERRQSAVIGGVVTGQSAIDVESIGAGGGSIAHIDTRGLMRVGPHSARATPGPACYGRGGVEPTVTDAMLVLGYLDPDNFLGGTMRLDLDAAVAAYERLGKPLGLSAREAALGAREIALAEMSKALKARIASGGLDARQYMILSYGGCGGLCAADLALSVHARGVLAPAIASVLSAFGAASADLRRERSISVAQRLPMSQDQLNDGLSELGEQVVRDLRSDGFDGDMRLIREADLRLYRQKASLTLDLPDGDVDQELLLKTFRDTYSERYGRGAMSGAAIELSALRVIGVGATARATQARVERAHRDHPPSLGTREVWLERERAVKVPIYDAEALRSDDKLTGPALIDAKDTTIWVPAHADLRVTEEGTLVIHTNRPAEAKREAKEEVVA
jgi:N-methylhydantoinase A